MPIYQRPAFGKLRCGILPLGIHGETGRYYNLNIETSRNYNVNLEKRK